MFVIIFLLDSGMTVRCSVANSLERIVIFEIPAKLPRGQWFKIMMTKCSHLSYENPSLAVHIPCVLAK